MATRRLTTCVVLLVLATVSVALAASSTAAPPPPEGKVRVTLWYADEEEARWVDHWTGTHQPLGSGGGRFTLTPASPEVSACLNRLSNAAKGATETRDGEAGARADGRRDGGSYHHVEFDHEDPHGRVIQDFLSHLARLQEDLKRAKAQ